MRAALILITIIPILMACEGGGASSDLHPTVGTGNSDTSASVYVTPSPSPTPVNLDGRYKYTFTRCYSTQTDAGATERYMTISGSYVQMSENLNGSTDGQASHTGNCGVVDTILYELNLAQNKFDITLIHTDGYNSPGYCTHPTRVMGTGNSVSDYTRVNAYLILTSANDCDAAHHKLMTYYTKQ